MIVMWLIYFLPNKTKSTHQKLSIYALYKEICILCLSKQRLSYIKLTILGAIFIYDNYYFGWAITSENVIKWN